MNKLQKRASRSLRLRRKIQILLGGYYDVDTIKVDKRFSK